MRKRAHRWPQSQWNIGVQMKMPFSMVIDVAYTGRHSANGQSTVNINSIDLGAAFLNKNQNPVAATSATSTDPTTSYASTNPDVIRFYQGYGAISMVGTNLHRTYHSFQVSVNRRLKNGLSFGFFDTMGLYDQQNAPPRLQHNADGTVTIRSDQAKADELLGNQNPQAHVLRGNFTWKLPRLTGTGGMKRIVGYAVNGWSLNKGRVIELRVDLFNAFNQAGITGRVTSMTLSSPSDPTTISNLPNSATGQRTLPSGAGFGVANGYQAPRSAQLQIRFAF